MMVIKRDRDGERVMQPDCNHDFETKPETSHTGNVHSDALDDIVSGEAASNDYACPPETFLKERGE